MPTDFNETKLFGSWVNQQINVSLNLPTIAAPISLEAPRVEAGTSQLSVPMTPVSSNSPEVWCMYLQFILCILFIIN